jgi:hypothetical protein
MKPDFKEAAKDTANKKYLPLANWADNDLPVHSRNFVRDTNKGSFIYGFLNGCEHGYSEAMKEQRWIPVSERNPAVNERVQVWTNCLGVATYKGSDKYGDKWIYDGSFRATYNGPSHWQPLPYPPSFTEQEQSTK